MNNEKMTVCAECTEPAELNGFCRLHLQSQPTPYTAGANERDREIARNLLKANLDPAELAEIIAAVREQGRREILERQNGKS